MRWFQVSGVRFQVSWSLAVLCVLCLCASVVNAASPLGAAFNNDIELGRWTNVARVSAATNTGSTGAWSGPATQSWWYATQPTNALGAGVVSTPSNITITATSQLAWVRWQFAGGADGVRLWRGSATNSLTNWLAMTAGLTNFYDAGTNTWSNGTAVATATNVPALVLYDGTRIDGAADLGSITSVNTSVEGLGVSNPAGPNVVITGAPIATVVYGITSNTAYNGAAGAAASNLAAATSILSSNNASLLSTGMLLSVRVPLATSDTHQPLIYVGGQSGAGEAQRATLIFSNVTDSSEWGISAGAAGLQRVEVDADKQIQATFTAWDAGNDGAGSGLDADLLDGLSSADFASSASLTAASNSLRAGIAGASNLALAAWATASNALPKSGGIVTGELFLEHDLTIGNQAVGSNGVIRMYDPNSDTYGTTIRSGVGAGGSALFFDFNTGEHFEIDQVFGFTGNASGLTNISGMGNVFLSSNNVFTTGTAQTMDSAIISNLTIRAMGAMGNTTSVGYVLSANGALSGSNSFMAALGDDTSSITAPNSAAIALNVNGEATITSTGAGGNIIAGSDRGRIIGSASASCIIGNAAGQATISGSGRGNAIIGCYNAPLVEGSGNAQIGAAYIAGTSGALNDDANGTTGNGSLIAGFNQSGGFTKVNGSGSVVLGGTGGSLVLNANGAMSLIAASSSNYSAGGFIIGQNSWITNASVGLINLSGANKVNTLAGSLAVHATNGFNVGTSTSLVAGAAASTVGASLSTLFFAQTNMAPGLDVTLTNPYPCRVTCLADVYFLASASLGQLQVRAGGRTYNSFCGGVNVADVRQISFELQGGETFVATNVATVGGWSNLLFQTK